MKIRITLLLLAGLALTAAVAQAQVYGKDAKKYTVVKPDLVALGAKKISSDGKTLKGVAFREHQHKRGRAVQSPGLLRLGAETFRGIHRRHHIRRKHDTGRVLGPVLSQ